ncbi:uncharacterized protein CC84DRAFT_1206558 [Paraphaeosphaeria sporulosa]|uniref:Glycosyl hydrolase family 32 N-terminal domain-containing protein n=1 Tax=Paraphaeosphaeria sporulosa TaxID=1460663 RepID=A0A177CCZ3_9PLEO|nr:uncharacterized protein CC84DRAFT_1206558 [Paraphaeosphaeria sporulosa]OAG05051.1 hypothetical protein CC84DRAFT_1206558 [Paraphaeosphaeria sporulosa]
MNGFGTQFAGCVYVKIPRGAAGSPSRHRMPMTPFVDVGSMTPCRSSFTVVNTCDHELPLVTTSVVLATALTSMGVRVVKAQTTPASGSAIAVEPSAVVPSNHPVAASSDGSNGTAAAANSSRYTESDVPTGTPLPDNPTEVSGNVHLGHATSEDLYTWVNQPIALFPGASGEGIFSGSAVIDTNGVVAIYTLNTAEKQIQEIGCSYDNGYSFIKYSGNPVMDSNTTQFRDPKIIWYAPTDTSKPTPNIGDASSLSGTLKFTFLSSGTGEYVSRGTFIFSGDVWLDRGHTGALSDNPYFTDKSYRTALYDPASGSWNIFGIIDRSILGIVVNGGVPVATSVFFLIKPLESYDPESRESERRR